MDISNMKVKEIDTYLGDISIDMLPNVLETLEQDNRVSVHKLIVKYRKNIEKHVQEKKRIQQLWKYENHLLNKGIQFVVGVDEAGRGPLAGPVFAAAVILPHNIFIEGIDDSKKISEKKREKLYDIIIEKAVSYKIISVSEQEIDSINIRNATYKAMVQAINGLEITPEYALIDGDDIKGLTIPYSTIPKGDSLSISIAAASILAKVARDRYIKELDEVYPQYGFSKHKGYGTKEHIDAIKTYGMSAVHRKTFMTKIIGNK